MLVMLITLGLLGGLAVATTANPRLLEVFWGKDFEPSAQASAYIAHDLAEVETNGYRVRVEEAVYDGMTLYVRYSIRDMSCDHLLGETNVDTGRRMLNEQEITAFDHAPVGWWTDNLWLNGQNVDMPGLSGGETWAGDENGEIVVSEMYRLDQVGVFLSGDVQIDLPIGEKQHYDYETWQSMLKEDGTFRKPDAGLVSFTLNCDAPVTHYADGERVILPDGTAAWVESADDTPVKLYVTVRFEISDAQRKAFRAENGEGYVFPDGTMMPFDDVDMVGSWVYGLTLVDADGKPLRASLGYGEGNWGVGSGVADYVFSHEDAYPEQVYLAPQTGEDSADMAWAIPLPVRERAARLLFALLRQGDSFAAWFCVAGGIATAGRRMEGNLMFGQKKSAQKNLPSKTQKVLVRPTGLEPVPIAGHAPQTCAYANSATAASARIIIPNSKGFVKRKNDKIRFFGIFG